MKIRPAGHRVLIKLKPFEEVTKAGIIIATPENAEREKYAMQEATVISLGQTAFRGFDNGEPWCFPDDRVLIAKYSGVDQVDPKTGDIYRIINDEDIIAIFEDED